MPPESRHTHRCSRMSVVEHDAKAKKRLGKAPRTDPTPPNVSTPTGISEVEGVEAQTSRYLASFRCSHCATAAPTTPQARPLCPWASATTKSNVHKVACLWVRECDVRHHQRMVEVAEERALSSKAVLHA